MILSPTQQLMEDHELILQVLDLMEKTTEKIAGGGDIQSGPWEYFIQFAQEFSDALHHHKEEKLLFPALLQAGLPSEDGPIPCMLSEHEQGRGYIRNLALALKQYQAGEESARRKIIETSNEYVYLLRQHITKENQILFLMADRLLSLSEKKRLVDQLCEWTALEKNQNMESNLKKMFEELRQSSLS